MQLPLLPIRLIIFIFITTIPYFGWIPNSSDDEAIRIWNLGKQIGFTTLESQECVIQCLEASEGES